MKRSILVAVAISLVVAITSAFYTLANAQDYKTFNLWPDLAPGEKADAERSLETR